MGFWRRLRSIRIAPRRRAIAKTVPTTMPAIAPPANFFFLCDRSDEVVAVDVGGSSGEPEGGDSGGFVSGEVVIVLDIPRPEFMVELIGEEVRFVVDVPV